MDGPPAQSLGVEPVHGAIVKRAPRKASDPVISARLMCRVLSSGALIVVGTLWVFSLGMTQVINIPEARMHFTRKNALVLFCCAAQGMLSEGQAFVASSVIVRTSSSYTVVVVVGVVVVALRVGACACSAIARM